MRGRITSVAVVTALLATLIFGVPLGAFAAQFFLDRERIDVERVAALAAVGAAADLARGERPAQMPSGDASERLALFDTSGSLVVGRAPASAGPAVSGALRGRVTTDDDAGGYLVVAVPVTDGREVVGAVAGSTGYAEVRWQIIGTWAVMLGFAAAAVGAAGLLARRQARRLAQPLEALSVAAQRLGDGDFSVRPRRSGISEIDAVAGSISLTAARLDELVRRERELAAHASHQLRTPLTALRLTLEIAADQPPAVAARAVGTALEAADRLERTITDLLQLAHGEVSAQALLDVGAVAEEAAASARPGLTARGRALHVSVDADLPATTAASAAVRQVLAVLLDNATVHGAGAVSLHVREASGAVAMDVGDGGSGIADPASLFTRGPLPSEAGTGRGGPSGIGLGLARTLSEGQGGRLTLTRAQPPVFTLLLPAAPPRDAAALTR